MNGCCDLSSDGGDSGGGTAERAEEYGIQCHGGEDLGETLKCLSLNPREDDRELRGLTEKILMCG